jgi:quinol monooxygenase YgiN
MPLTLTGRLICTDRAQLDILRTHLPGHIRLTHLEPGCEHFEVTQSSDPLVWELHERFASRADFEAHQARTKASHWGQVSAGIARDYQITESA